MILLSDISINDDHHPPLHLLTEANDPANPPALLDIQHKSNRAAKSLKKSQKNKTENPSKDALVKTDKRLD